jgi:hypothetical protein
MDTIESLRTESGRNGEHHASHQIYARDPLYGEIWVPSLLADVLASWELQRLRYVRLINVNSLPLATLGDTYRYAHTLGVLHLGLTSLSANNIPYESALGRLLLSALALHDIGTPAFGHSLEYVLKEQHGYDHVDAAIEAVCGSKHTKRSSKPKEVSTAPAQHAWKHLENLSHAGLRKTLKQILGRAFTKPLEEALRGFGPVGHLVASAAIDLDNVDNVFRMAAALGIRSTWQPEDPHCIASSLRIPSLSEGPPVVVCASAAVESIQRWHATRREVYRVLNLNPMNLAGLAMLREFFEEYALMHTLDPSAWWTTDADALETMTLKHTAHLASRIRRGDLYTTIAILHINLVDPALRPLEKLFRELRAFSELLSDALDHRVRVHALFDRDTFDRRVPLRLDTGDDLTIGSGSRSIIISVHGKGSRAGTPDPISAERQTMTQLAQWFALSESTLRLALLNAGPPSQHRLPDAPQLTFRFYL